MEDDEDDDDDEEDEELGEYAFSIIILISTEFSMETYSSEQNGIGAGLPPTNTRSSSFPPVGIS